MALTAVLIIMSVVAFIFLYFKDKSLTYKLVASAVITVISIALFYLFIVVAWNSSKIPAEERLNDTPATERI